MIDNVVYVGTEVQASTVFKDETSRIVNTTIDPNKYPSYSVVDPQGDAVLEGIATYNAAVQRYEVSFLIPQSVPVSCHDKPWTLNWQLKDITGRLYTVSERFTVTVPNFSESEVTEIQRITFPFTPFSISFPLNVPPDSIETTLYDYSTNPIHKINLECKGFMNGFHIYQGTIPPNNLTAGAKYMLVTRIVINGTDNYHHTKLHVIDMNMAAKISDVRVMLDRTLKQSNLHISYRDSDLAWGIEQGLNRVNLVPPLTQWDYSYFYTSNIFMTQALIYSSCYEILMSQLLAEADNSFEYSGQAVTLSSDRTGAIESALGRFGDWLDNKLPQIKAQEVRSQSSYVIGHLGVMNPTVKPLLGFNGMNYRTKKQRHEDGYK